MEESPVGAPCVFAPGTIIHTRRRVQADATLDASSSFLQLEHWDSVDAVVIYFAEVGYSIGTRL
jgi:hypothetical protein